MPLFRILSFHVISVFTENHKEKKNVVHPKRLGLDSAGSQIINGVPLHVHHPCEIRFRECKWYQHLTQKYYVFLSWRDLVFFIKRKVSKSGYSQWTQWFNNFSVCKMLALSAFCHQKSNLHNLNCNETYRILHFFFLIKEFSTKWVAPYPGTFRKELPFFFLLKKSRWVIY